MIAQYQTMNPLQKLLLQKPRNLLSLFFTAGYPHLDSTQDIIVAAEQAGIDFLEVGMPYSDPLADGPVIQESSTRAIANGMNLEVLFLSFSQCVIGYRYPCCLWDT